MVQAAAAVAQAKEEAAAAAARAAAADTVREAMEAAERNEFKNKARKLKVSSAIKQQASGYACNISKNRFWVIE